MKPIYRRGLSRVLLISFFLQSCGIEVPISGHQPEGVGPDGIQQLETTSGSSAAPPLSAEGLHPQSGFVHPHDGPAQPLPGVSAAVVQDGAVEEPQSGALELTEVDRLFNAIHDGRMDEINSLLSKDRGLLEVLSERDDEGVRKQGYTLLMYAAHLGSEPMVRLLLSWKSEVNKANKDGLTALHMAAEKGHLEVVRCLSENNAKPDVRDNEGLTAFHLASRSGYSTVTDYLRERVVATLYTDLVEATSQGGTKETVNEIIFSLARFISCLDERASVASRYVNKLTQDHGVTWCGTVEGQLVIRKLNLIVQESAHASELRDAVQEFTISNSPENRAKLIDILLQLAALHREQGEVLGELSYYTDAATCYRHILSICGEEDVVTDYESQINSARQGLLAVRKALISASSIDDIKLQEEIVEDKQELEGLRVDAQVKADKLETLLNQRSTPAEERASEAVYIQRSKALFHDIAEKIKAFLARLYRESEQELGPAPCKYSVM
ncbi:MAG: ankyrin repeat domain-containing protein, partial [Bacteroidota bacterium]